LAVGRLGALSDRSELVVNEGSRSRSSIGEVETCIGEIWGYLGDDRYDSVTMAPVVGLLFLLVLLCVEVVA
jgi:hypothetical protein